MATRVISLDSAQHFVIKKALKELGLEHLTDQVEFIMLGQAPPKEIIRLVNIVYQAAWMDEGLKITNLVNKFMPPITRRVRILESANLELAYVACGRLDAYINPEDKVWDIAAGSLMIASAGGRTKILQGSISTLKNCKGIVASNQFLIEHLLEILNA